MMDTQTQRRRKKPRTQHKILPYGRTKPFHRERKFSPKFFWPKFFWTPWGHGRPRLRVMDVRAEMLVFFQDFEGLTEVFAPGRPPGYPRGRPRDIRPQNLLFGLRFRSWRKFCRSAAQSWPFLRLQNACRYSVVEASKLVSTKTLLLKHGYRRQRTWCLCPKVSLILGANAIEQARARALPTKVVCSRPSLG